MTAIPDVSTAILESSATERSDRIFVVDPSIEFLRSLLEAATNRAAPPRLRVLATPSIIEAISASFGAATRAAALLASGYLSLRGCGDLRGNQLVLTDTTGWTIIEAGEAVRSLPIEDIAFVGEVFEHYTDCWDEGEPVTFRTPPLDRLRTTLKDRFDGAVEADFTTLVETVDTVSIDHRSARQTGALLALLVAARHDELFYEISKWGEEVDLASKATFTRVKSQLESARIIMTEKVPLDVGRPRLRLRLAKQAYRETPMDELLNLLAPLL